MIHNGRRDGPTGAPVEARATTNVRRLLRGRSLRGLAQPAALYLALVAVAWVVVALTIEHLGLSEQPPPGLDLPDVPWLSAWVRWDAGWYLRIVHEGYTYVPGTQSTVAFFPGYPLLIRAVDLLPIDMYMAAIGVTVAAGLTAVVLLARWCQVMRPGRPALPAVAALVLSPFAYYLLGAVYSDAVFLAAAIGAFYLLERGRPVSAGLVGALATLTRPVGPAIVVGLAWRAWELHRRPPAPVAGRPRSSPWWWAAVGLSVLGVAAYCVFLAVEFGEPFAFIEQTGVPGWDQSPGPRTWFKVRFFEAMFEASNVIRLRNMAHVTMVVAALATLPTVLRRYGRAYAAYVALIVVVPAMSSGDFMGLGRYVLAAFPAFVAAADILETRPRLQLAVYSAGGVAMLTGAALFARGVYVS